MTERTFTERELQRYNGERGERVCLALIRLIDLLYQLLAVTVQPLSNVRVTL